MEAVSLGSPAGRPGTVRAKKYITAVSVHTRVRAVPRTKAKVLVLAGGTWRRHAAVPVTAREKSFTFQPWPITS
jgi:hypothetical protein